MSLVAENRLVRDFAYQRARSLVLPGLAILLAIIIGGIVVGVAEASLGAPFTGYGQLLKGAFGTPYDVTETLVAAVPLMFAAFAVAFAFRGGLFNIGAEGQMYAGAIASTYFGYTLGWSGWLLLPFCMLVAVVAGGIYAAVPGFLKAWRGAHEVITTMMLNYVAAYLLQYLLQANAAGQPGPMENKLQIGNPQSPIVNADFPSIVPSSIVANNRLSLVLPVALACGVVFWFILWRTTLGYSVRAVGFNPKAARYAGMSVTRTIVTTMFIAGAFAGLAGMAYVFGIQGYLVDNFDGFGSGSGYGFNAIAVALLGRNTAVGAILAAILFGALEHGGTNMQASAGVNVHLIEIIQGLIIFFVGASLLIQYLANKGVAPLQRWRSVPPEPQEVAA